MMKIVIIGGIAAGMSAAAKVRRLLPEATINVYEKSAHVSFGACGLPYYVGDFFDDPDFMIARTKEAFEKTGVNVFTEHEVEKVDPAGKIIQVKNLQTGESFSDSYDKLMIATGAHAIMPPFSNRENKENMFCLKSMEDGLAIKKYLKQPEIKHVTIGGGGFIGLELVEALTHLGKKVSLIQLEERVMPDNLDAEMSEYLTTELLDNSVDLHLSESVSGFIGDEKITDVVTNRGQIKTDAVIVAVGIKPNTDFVADAGFERVFNGALVIDKMGRTSIPDIYAAGDCATIYNQLTGLNNYLPLATYANKMGRIVGENLAGKNIEFAGALATSGLKVCKLEVARTGLSQAQAEALGIPCKSILIHDKNQTNYYPGQDDLHIKLIYAPDTKIILGAQIVGGRGAVLRIDVLATAITKKMTTEELGFLDLVYAPPFARTWDALNVAGNVAK